MLSGTRRYLRPSVRWHTGPAVLFFGTDDYSVACLKSLKELRDAKTLSSLEVVCAESLKMSVPIRSYAERHRIRTHAAPSGRTMTGWALPTPAEGDRFDLAVVASFGYFIPKSLIAAFPLGGINAHPSLLPRWRGASPIYFPLLHGETMTGVSIIELHPRKTDAGAILAQIKHPVSCDATYATLRAELAALSGPLLADTVANLAERRRAAREQNDAEATAAPKITREAMWVNWEKQSPSDVYNLWRASGDLGGPWTRLKGRELRLVKVLPPRMEAPEGAPLSSVPGIVHIERGRKEATVWVRANGGWVGVASLQFATRAVQSGLDFANGYTKGGNRLILY